MIKEDESVTDTTGSLQDLTR